MAAGNLFSAHFPLSHLAHAELSVFIYGVELNTGVSLLIALNQTSLVSVIVCFILGFHGGLQNRVFFPKELTTVNDTRRRCPGKVMAVGSFPSLICDKTGSAEHLHYLVKVTIVADEHFGPWCG